MRNMFFRRRRGRTFAVAFSTLAATILWVLPVVASAAGTRPLAIGSSCSTPPCLSPLKVIGGPAAAGLYGWGVATLADGSVLVGDYWNFRIQHYAKTGALLGTIIPPASNHLAPYGIAVDPNDGSIYFGDVDQGHDVEKYDANGNYLLTINRTDLVPFNYPARIAVASDSNVYISDMRAHRIDVVDKLGNPLFSWGGKGSGHGQFNSPRGLAFDSSDNLYVADNYNHRVQVFDKLGHYITQFGQAGTLPGQFGPLADLRGVAIDNVNGWIYVSDKAAGYVNKYDLRNNFNYLLRFGGYGSARGKFQNGPREITVDGDGNVWVGDLAGFRVQKFSGATGLPMLYEPNPPQPPPPGGFNGAMGISVDSAGNVWAADRYNQRVEEFNSAGALLLTFGHRGSGTDGMNYARAVATDPVDGSLYVDDTDAQMIKKYDANGNPLYSVGKFGTGQLQFNESQGLDVGTDRNVYIADSLNQRVQVMNSAGAFLYTFGTKGKGPGKFLQVRSVEYDSSDQTLWTVDDQRGVVSHFSNLGATPTLLGEFGSPGTADNQFAQPSDVEVDANYVYVTDGLTHNIKIWTKGGQFVQAYGGFGTGLGQFEGPYGIDFGPDGNLYVMEQQNNRIQVLSVATS